MIKYNKGAVKRMRYRNRERGGEGGTNE